MKISTETSRKLKRSIVLLWFAMILFTILYLLMVAVSLALLIASIYLVKYLITSMPSFILILFICIPIVFVTLMLFIFVVRFAFLRMPKEQFSGIELSQEENPKLVQLIKEVARMCETSPPQHIYLAYDVNASAYFEYTFSLPFRIGKKKMLYLGLGLFNVLSIYELKTVLAHEFGHFSQRSLRLSHWTNNTVRKINYLISFNEEWYNALERFAQINGFTALFAQITNALANFVSYLLRAAINVVNTASYFHSRQMELHADEVAAQVMGKRIFLQTLVKIDLGAGVFNKTIERVNIFADNKKLFVNIYENHAFDINHNVKRLGFKVDNKLPVLPDDLKEMVRTEKPRVKYENLWDSHPTFEQRSTNLSHLPSQSTSMVYEHCWKLFGDLRKLQLEMSDKMYQFNSEEKKECEHLETIDYKVYVNTLRQKYWVNSIYGNFYNNRNYSVIHTNDVARYPALENPDEEFDVIFGKKSFEKIGKLNVFNSDINILESIQSREIVSKQFEFEGKKYPRRKAKKVISMVMKEIEALESEIGQLDRKAFSFFYSLAKQESPKYKKRYLEKYKALYDTKELFDFITKIATSTQELFSKLALTSDWDYNTVRPFNQEVQVESEELSDFLKRLPIEEVEIESEASKKAILEFMKTADQSVQVTEVETGKLMELDLVIQEVAKVLQYQYWSNLKSFTDYQLKLCNKKW